MCRVVFTYNIKLCGRLRSGEAWFKDNLDKKSLLVNIDAKILNKIMAN
jgi:hypothetical protein